MVPDEQLLRKGERGGVVDVQRDAAAPAESIQLDTHANIPAENSGIQKNVTLLLVIKQKQK